MNRFPKTGLVLFCLFGLGFVHVAYGQDCTGEGTNIDPAFTCDRWTIHDGLPVNSIKQVFQSSDGYLWIITYNGIARFDGVSFTIFDTTTNPELPVNRFQGMYETPDGRLWFESEKSQLLFSLENDRFKQWNTETGMAGNQVLEFHIARDGTVWIGTEAGISIYNNGAMAAFEPELIAGRVDRIFADTDSTFFFRHNGIISRYSQGKISTILDEPQRDRPYHPFARLQDGNILFGADEGLFRYANNKVDLIHTFEDSSEYIHSIFPSKNKEVLFSSSASGFWRMDSSGNADLYQPYKEGATGTASDVVFSSSNEEIWKNSNKILYRDGSPVLQTDDFIVGYTRDREGSMWVGTYASGLYRLKKNPFRTISTQEGMSGQNIYPMIETRSGDFMVGTMFGGINKIGRDGNITSVGIDGVQIRALYERQNGTLLIGKDAPFVYEFKNDELVPWNPDSVHIPEVIHAFFEDSRQQLFVGSNSGLFLHRNNRWRNLTEKLKLPEHPVRYFASAPDSTLWMATAGSGIIRMDKDLKFDRFNVGQENFQAKLIRSIFIEPKLEPNSYYLWIGTENHGLVRALWDSEYEKPTEISRIGKKQGLPNNTIHQILEDDEHNFWMSTNAGIIKVQIDSLHRWMDENTPEIDITTFTEFDGLRNREANGGIQPAGFVSSKGNIWFPTQDGIVIADPEQIVSNEVPPPVKIEHINASGFSAINPKKTTLRANQRNFEISYTGLSFMVPEKVNFKYRLKGLDESWTEAGTRRTAFFTNVPAGTYKFEVFAANNEEVWSRQPASLSVEIQPFFYEQRIFFVFLFMVAGLLCFIIIQFRSRHLKKREKELEDSVKKRTAELEHEKRKTEAQARELLELNTAKNRFFTNISHEFRTPLTLIISPLHQLQKKLKKTANPDLYAEMERMLRNSKRLQRLINQILDLSRLEAGEMKLAVEQIELSEFLEKITDLFKPVCEEQNLSITLNTDGNKHIVFADYKALENIFANLISNAVKFTPAEGGINIELKDQKESFAIKISDNGVGIPKEKLEHIFERFYQVDSSSTRVTEGTGVGLALVKNLVEIHHASIEVHSKVGVGTSVIVTLMKNKKHFSPNDFKQPGEADKDFREAARSEYIPKFAARESGIDESEEDKPKVLVAEDNPDMQIFIAEVLSEQFYVRIAENGKVALKIIQTFIPDLIIADIMMPVMDGVGLYKQVKKDPLLMAVPFIFLTAKADTESKIEGLENGVDAYLTKPFKTEILIANVHNLINQRKTLREYYLNQPKERLDSKPLKNDFLKKLEKIAEQNFADPGFGVQQLAEAMHFERSYLYRKIKKETGQSSHQYLTNYRMNQAAKMIQNKEGNLSEIAYASGFNSLSYFSRCFKEKFGMPPSDFAES